MRYRGESVMTHENKAANCCASSRQDQLQFMRFLAFLNVFIAHAEVWLFFPYRTSHCATAAVSFFFMLSGMVTGYSFVRKEQLKFTLKAETSFVWKRLRKIYPLYLATTLIAVIRSDLPVSVISGNLQQLKETGTQLLRNLLMIQAWFPEGALSFNGASWFLSALVFLYVCSIPLGCLLNRLTRSRARYWLFGAAFLGTAFCIVLYSYLTQSDMFYWHYRLPAARLGEYFLGMIIGYVTTLLRGRISTEHWRRWLFTAAEIFVLAFWYFSLSRPGNYWRNHNVAWLIPNTLLLTVFSIGGGWISQLFRWKPLVYLGDISFEAYLVHYMLIIQLDVNTQMIPPSTAGNVFCFLFCLLLSLILAAVTHGKAGASPKSRSKSN